MRLPAGAIALVLMAACGPDGPSAPGVGGKGDTEADGRQTAHLRLKGGDMPCTYSDFKRMPSFFVYITWGVQDCGSWPDEPVLIFEVYGGGTDYVDHGREVWDQAWVPEAGFTYQVVLNCTKSNRPFECDEGQAIGRYHDGELRNGVTSGTITFDPYTRVPWDQIRMTGTYRVVLDDGRVLEGRVSGEGGSCINPTPNVCR